MEFKNLSLTEIINQIQTEKTTAQDVWKYFENRIEELDNKVEAFNYLAKEMPNFPDKTTKFAGVTIGVKDIFNEVGIPTTAGSKMLANYISPYESTTTANVKKDGAVSIGKLNMDEFAMGGSGETSAMRITKNPWDTERIPGGSSSGSAAAVAAGLVPAALGTDTGGSIRQPASMCGIVGFKPTYGRISRYGAIAMSSSLDTMGTLTKTVKDAGFMYTSMAGKDPQDATSLRDEVTLDDSIWDKKDLTGLKIGVPEEYFAEGLDPEVRVQVENSIEKMRALGAQIKPVSLPHSKYGLGTYYIIMPCEASTNLSRYDGVRFGHTTQEPYDNYADFVSKTRSEGFGEEVQRRIMLGSFALSSGFYDAYYKKAVAVRELIRKDFDDVFEQVDVIVGPTAPTVAWKIGAKTSDPLEMYLSDVLTVGGSLAGIPGISIPCGYASPSDDTNKKLPVGLQIMGPRLGEEVVFSTAHVMEGALKDIVASEKPEVF